jgi:multidrug transporter EmrE-like cation transporter
MIFVSRDDTAYDNIQMTCLSSLNQNGYIYICIFAGKITWFKMFKIRFPKTQFTSSLQIYHSFLQVYIIVKIHCWIFPLMVIFIDISSLCPKGSLDDIRFSGWYGIWYGICHVLFSILHMIFNIII